MSLLLQRTPNLYSHIIRFLPSNSMTPIKNSKQDTYLRAEDSYPPSYW